MSRRSARPHRPLLLALLVTLAACADEGGELFGDATRDEVTDDSTEFAESEVFGDPAELEGREVVVRANVDEVLAPRLFLLEHEGEHLLVTAPPDDAGAVGETDLAHVEGVIARFDFADIEADFPGAAGHATLEQYESTSIIEASSVVQLDDDEDRST